MIVTQNQIDLIPLGFLVAYLAVLVPIILSLMVIKLVYSLPKMVKAGFDHKTRKIGSSAKSKEDRSEDLRHKPWI